MRKCAERWGFRAPCLPEASAGLAYAQAPVCAPRRLVRRREGSLHTAQTTVYTSARFHGASTVYSAMQSGLWSSLRTHVRTEPGAALRKPPVFEGMTGRRRTHHPSLEG